MPSDFSVVQQLWRLVKAREDEQGEDVILEVVAIGDLDQFLNRA